MTRTQTLKKFKDKTLGITGSLEVGGDYYVKDFLDKEMLMYFFFELVNHDTDLTKFGYQFLEEYYGLDQLAQIIESEVPDFKERCGLSMSIESWLKTKGEFAV